MAVKTKYYFGDPGSYSIRDAELAFTIVEWVTRSGTVYNVTTTGEPDPSVMLCKHNISTGEISWGVDLPFPSFVDRPSRESLEKISVKFKF